MILIQPLPCCVFSSHVLFLLLHYVFYTLHLRSAVLLVHAVSPSINFPFLLLLQFTALALNKPSYCVSFE